MKREAYPADASSLIYIAKADAFEEIMSCIDGIGVPPGVWHEAVDAGEEIGAAEVPRIRDAEARGFLQRLSLDEDQVALAASIASEHRLGRGESEVLALARPGTRAIVDEGRAARAARSLGIVPSPRFSSPSWDARAVGWTRARPSPSCAGWQSRRERRRKPSTRSRITFRKDTR